ncbi:post-PEP-CTERM-1 domain-containing protein [Pseudoduganella sp. OTU4001]|uniref:post-PEP-CTERM-1 domain-containing protein n=1 Tax=Pseudoduganella sp. OTU4001 TaxID=3043854 RepID=UPI00313B985A
MKSKICLLGLALAAALPLHAQEAAQAEPVAQQLTVVRDAETGKLRAPTAEEQAAIQNPKQAQRMRQAAPQPLIQKFHKSGAQGVRLNSEYGSMAVAVRGEDGKLNKLCFDRHDVAEATVQGHTHIAPKSIQSDTE